jgi:peroxiredoxin
MLLLARVVLAGVLAVAALAKLTDRDGARRSMVAFGAPESLATPIMGVLVACELCVAVALLYAPTRSAGAFGALALLAGLTAVVAGSVARGQTPDCHCFGRLSAAPVGSSTLARNALLATIAAYVAVGGRLPLLFAALVAVAAGLWLGLGPLRSRGRSRGAPAPRFSLPDRAGTTWTLEALLARRAPVLLLFSHPACGACQEMLPDIARWQSRFEDQITLAVLSGDRSETGPHPQHADGAEAHGLRNLLVDEAGRLAQAYGITATPSAVLIDREGRIAAPTARGAGEITDLVSEATGTREQPRLARRELIARAAFGLASLGMFGLVTSAYASSKRRPAKRPKELHIDGAYLCDHRYALCTDAACVPSTSDPSIVICDCFVKTGWAVGFKSCAQRAAKGNTLHSNFSTQLVTNATRVMTCPKNDPWAECLDVVCEIDPHDARKAKCQCVLFKAGPSVTFGGDCDTKTCSSTIWSATTPNLPGSTQLETGMKQLGLPLTLPKPCPSPTPGALHESNIDGSKSRMGVGEG